MNDFRPFGLDLDPQVAVGLQSGLTAVEELLAESVTGEYPFLTQVSRHLVDAGGKRLRPLLVLLGAQFGDPSAPGVTPAAVVVELTHLATLYHDDVMDEALLRRGAESANSRYGNSVAILTGDYLFARASDLLADLGPQAVRIQARTFARLVTGQVRETVGPTPQEDPVEHHLQVLADKTGSLIACAGRFGGLMSGADSGTVEVLADFGEKFGVAFQLSDDLLDIASVSQISGKTPGTDLREGVATLPVLLARRSTNPQDARLLQLTAGPIIDDDEHGEALALLRAHPALSEARDVTRQWAEGAREALSALPAGSVTDALSELCDLVVTRSV
ncbi:MAG: polyprenyl synthetase family protein [Actinomycetes bacterium]